MHLLVRETRGLDEAEAAVDLGQSRADLVFLSFSDSDLGALAASWSARGEAAPSLRLANLSRLRHPMSVDLYVEQVIACARCVVIRLLGGLDYWRYGAEEIAHAARANNIPLALLPGDGRDDARLSELSTVDGATLARLDAFFAAGGPENMRRALDLMAHLAGLAPDHGLAAELLPMHGVHRLDVPEVSGRTACGDRVLPRLSARRRPRAHRGVGAGARPRGPQCSSALRREPQGSRHGQLRLRNVARLGAQSRAQCHRVLRPP